MPRINIEESFWSDDRHQRLCIKLGCEFKAAGLRLIAIKIAQKYWFDNKNPIPEDAFHNAKLDILLDCHFVKKVDGGYYLRGSEDYFAWYYTNLENIEYKREAGRIGGRISAQRPRNKKGQLQPKQNPSKTQAVTKQVTNDVQHSSSSSSSSNKELIYTAFAEKIEETYMEHYPKKRGKKEGLDSLKSQIKNEEQLKDLCTAIINYKEYTKNEDQKYILHFSTFCNKERWKDFINIQYLKERKPLSADDFFK